MKSFAPLVIILYFLIGLFVPAMLLSNFQGFTFSSIILIIFGICLSCYSFYFSFTLLKLHLKEN